jgi:hypothetical protein
MFRSNETIFRPCYLSVLKAQRYGKIWYWINSWWWTDSVPPWSCSKAVCKPVWDIPLLIVQWINSWWWTDSVPPWSCSEAVCKPVWHIPLLSVQWLNVWWWTEELSETCRVSWQNKFVKLVHLVGFVIRKFVTMQHGHMNVEKIQTCLLC